MEKRPRIKNQVMNRTICPRCNKPHFGTCITCFNFGKLGHIARVCSEKLKNTRNRAVSRIYALDGNVNDKISAVISAHNEGSHNIAYEMVISHILWQKIDRACIIGFTELKSPSSTHLGQPTLRKLNCVKRQEMWHRSKVHPAESSHNEESKEEKEEECDGDDIHMTDIPKYTHLLWARHHQYLPTSTPSTR
ncbi:hypothetical protein Fot_37319 [Forsythia ovata]|uniref:CCHC-type domain-containing protein n=1 Tax=Forsythia ovata TaxID=205694 RepID=A0ABD1RYS6_9LAMI